MEEAIANEFEWLRHEIKEAKEERKEIINQVSKQNGRVRKLEIYKERMLGFISAVVIFASIPSVIMAILAISGRV